MSALDLLLDRLKRSKQWPIKSEATVRAEVARWAALRDGDPAVLRRLAGWPNDRDYITDNLAEKIAEAYGTLLFGEDPVFTAARKNDQANLTGIIEDNALVSGLRGAEEVKCSEGEVWWRVASDPELAQAPAVTFHSRADVVPLLYGRRVSAVGFVSRLDEANDGDSESTRYRLIELHEPGRVRNVLFKGTDERLGDEIDLARHIETKDLDADWNHDLGVMLAGRIVRRWGRRPRLGLSIYSGIWPRFLVLNEAATIGKENMRLSAKKRAVVPASALKQSTSPKAGIGALNAPEEERRPAKPKWDAGEDVLVWDPLDIEEGGNNQAPFKILEYSFDAQSLIAYENHVAEIIAIRCDLVPQFIGQGDFGSAPSGTALRVRLLPTVNAAEGAARPWDDLLPQIIRTAQLVDAASPVQGGFGRKYSGAGELPSIQRTDALPIDESERADRLATLRSADLLSIKQGVKAEHPDWDDTQVDDEVEAIRSDIGATLPSVSFGGNRG
jgi:hypothetical protein